MCVRCVWCRSLQLLGGDLFMWHVYCMHSKLIVISVNKVPKPLELPMNIYNHIKFYKRAEIILSRWDLAEIWRQFMIKGVQRLGIPANSDKNGRLWWSIGANAQHCDAFSVMAIQYSNGANGASIANWDNHRYHLDGSNGAIQWQYDCQNIRWRSMVLIIDRAPMKKWTMVTMVSMVLIANCDNCFIGTDGINSTNNTDGTNSATGAIGFRWRFWISYHHSMFNANSANGDKWGIPNRFETFIKSIKGDSALFWIFDLVPGNVYPCFVQIYHPASKPRS